MVMKPDRLLCYMFLFCFSRIPIILNLGPVYMEVGDPM